MPDSINKVCSVQFDIHKYIQHLDSFCRVDGNCKGINRNSYSWLQLSKQPEQKTFLAIHTVVALSSAVAPARYPYKISNNRKNRKRTREDEKRDKAGVSSLFSLPIVPRALSFSFSPPSPQYKEASAEERGVVVYCKLPLITPLPIPPAKKYIRWWDPRPPLAWTCIKMNSICYDILKLNMKTVNAFDQYCYNSLF